MILDAKPAERREATTGGWWRRVFRLVSEDLRRTWVSYPATGAVTIVVGLFATSLVVGIFELEGFGEGGRTLEENFNGFVTDTFFLAVAPALGINLVLNRDYSARYRHDNMSRRLAFLRGLPVSPGEIVAARMLTMLLAFLVSVPLFFVPVLLVFPEGASIPELLGFAAIWTGYALAAAGFYMYAWLGFSGRQDLPGTIVLALGFPLAAALVNFVLGVHLVAGSVTVARAGGSLVAILALVVGAACFGLWGLLTTRKLQRRDLST